MAEVLTLNDTPADQPEFNADEKDSLAVAESISGEEQPLLAGKFNDPKALEQAYLALQQKLGEPNIEPEVGEEVQQDNSPLDEQSQQEETSSEDQLSETQAEQLFEMVGGKQSYQAMIDWAGENLSQAEIEMYDSVMASGSANSIYFAVQALNNNYTNSVGNDGELLTGNRSAAQQDKQFRSQQELVTAMSDPKYDTDPAYRDDVMRKLSNSDLQF
jgi:hypothetical protein